MSTIDNYFHCQIHYDTLKQRCKTQCDFCKTALTNKKEKLKQKNKTRSQRYYLHAIVKKEGYSINSRSRTILVKENTVLSDAVNKLKNLFQYNIQVIIP